MVVGTGRRLASDCMEASSKFSAQETLHTCSVFKELCASYANLAGGGNVIQILLL